MKYFFVMAMIVTLAAGCSKNQCVQCAQEVRNPSQTTTVTTDYYLKYYEFCGKQADSAMSYNDVTYSQFITDHNLIPNTCFYNQ